MRLYCRGCNSDGILNVVDIVQLVNIIFGLITPTEGQQCLIDVNGDEAVNVVDVVALVNLIFASPY